MGYLIGMLGPLSVGLLYHGTGGWLAPFGALLAALVIQVMAGLRVARPGTLEDEIDRAGPGQGWRAPLRGRGFERGAGTLGNAEATSRPPPVRP